MRILYSLSICTLVVGFLLPVLAFGGSDILPNAKPGGKLMPQERRGVVPGDADSDDQIDITDVAYLVDFFCNDGPAPGSPGNGDLGGSCYDTAHHE